MIHRIKVFFLSLVIALSPIILINNANAASIGGWNLSNPVAQGASVLYDAAKNAMINGKNVAKTSTALITPVAADVAKVLARGGAAYALSIAVEQLLGAVDWVLDAENNQIVYTKPGSADGFIYANHHELAKATVKSYSYIEACKLAISTYNSREGTKYKYSGASGGANPKCYFNDGYLFSIHAFPDTSKPEKRNLPLINVAEQVISNASRGDPAAQEATVAAAADILSESEKDAVKARPIFQQLEANSKTATDETATGEATPADPAATDAAKPLNISIEFPVFCGWAPLVCEAAQVAISFPITLLDWWETSKSKAESWANSISKAWTAVKDWVKTEEPAERQTQVDIESSALPEIHNDYLYWNAYCPFSAKSDEISLNGETSALSSDLTSWCTMASEIRPFVLLAGALASLMIVSGVGLGRSED